MQSKITITMTIFAAAAIFAGMSTTLLANVQAKPSPSFPTQGYPYGGLVSSEAQNGPGGFGADIKACTTCMDGPGLGDNRANDRAIQSSTTLNGASGKPGTSQDDLSSPIKLIP